MSGVILCILMTIPMQYDELCKAIAVLVGSQSTDSVELLQVLEQIVQVHMCTA